MYRQSVWTGGSRLHVYITEFFGKDSARMPLAGTSCFCSSCPGRNLPPFILGEGSTGTIPDLLLGALIAPQELQRQVPEQHLLSPNTLSRKEERWSGCGKRGNREGQKGGGRRLQNQRVPSPTSHSQSARLGVKMQLQEIMQDLKTQWPWQMGVLKISRARSLTE
jgi:hypothetical protein